MKERRPIFYDAERVRWRRTRRVLEISGLLLAVLLAYFFVTIAVSVELPAGLLPETRPAYRALKIKKKTPAREGRHRRISNIGTVPAGYDPLRAAFFVSWDAASFASLRSPNVCTLIPCFLSVRTIPRRFPCGWPTKLTSYFSGRSSFRYSR